MKKYQIIILLVCMVLVTGCGSKSAIEDAADKIGAAADAVSELAQKGEAALDEASEALNEAQEAVAPQGNSPSRDDLNNYASDHQPLIQSILNAKEKGYAYGGMMDFVVLGDKVKRQVMIGDSGSYTVGQVDGPCYEVTVENGEVTEKVEVDPEDLFGEYAAGDMQGDYTKRLQDTLMANAKDKRFAENSYSILIITDIQMEAASMPSGLKGTKITINTYPENSASDAGYEIYMVAEDGLLESYTLSTPILNKGKPAVTDFTFTSRGPIDASEFDVLNP